MNKCGKPFRCRKQRHDIDDRLGGVLEIAEIVGGDPFALVLDQRVFLPHTAGAERQMSDVFLDLGEVFVGALGDLEAAAEIDPRTGVQGVDQELRIIGQQEERRRAPIDQSRSYGAAVPRTEAADVTQVEDRADAHRGDHLTDPSSITT